MEIAIATSVIDFVSIGTLIQGVVGVIGGFLILFGAITLFQGFRDGFQGGGPEVAKGVGGIGGGAAIIALAVYAGSLFSYLGGLVSSLAPLSNTAIACLMPFGIA